MITPSYCQVMASYNKWMNRRLYTLCADIPDDKRKQDRGAFFKSIHGTLNHLLYGDTAWLCRFEGNEAGIAQMGVILYEDFDQLRTARNALDKRLLDWSAGVKHDWLKSDFSFTSKVDGQTRTRPAWLLVTHMFNHGTHHRGQLTTLLTQSGYDYGTTDIPFMPGFV